MSVRRREAPFSVNAHNIFILNINVFSSPFIDKYIYLIIILLLCVVWLFYIPDILRHFKLNKYLQAVS